MSYIPWKMRCFVPSPPSHTLSQNMASPVCRCGHPQACTCFATPLRNDHYYAPFQSPGPQNPWAHQLLALSPFNAGPSYPQAIAFQNSFQASFASPGSVTTPSPAHRMALGYTTNLVNSAPAQRQQKRRRNRSEAENDPARTRRRTLWGHPMRQQSLALGGFKRPSASYVWYFVRGVHPDVAPVSLPEREVLSTKLPDKKFAHLACRLCSLDEWTTWKNVEGQTTAIRKHLRSPAQNKLWRDLVLLKQLKGWETLGTSNKDSPCGEREEFSLPGFYERLVKWIAVDDQSIDVVDCPELRNLLLFVGAQLEDEDIPHRTMLSKLIAERFQVEYNKMIREIQVLSPTTCGRG
ncbi:hypothetical protein B0H10DRAFT_2432551 [Mycena sp. CBHHK59/15]|nr:hypothetical protein B0H10DRAFT_2432551 [Mycena sp. CBHHK59/15]